MVHLINKDAFVAEIENLVNTYKICSIRNSYEGGLRDGRLIGYKDALHIIDTLEVKEMQEEPVSIWHDASEETPTQGSNILMVRKEEKDTNYPPIAGCFHGTNSRLDGRNWGYYNGFCYNEIEPPVKWAYIDDILKLSNVQRTGKDCDITGIKFKHAEGKLKECIDSITEESLTKARKQLEEESVSGELDDVASNYVLNIRKGYPRVMDKTDRYICNAFKAGAKWKEQQFEKNRLAHCDALTEEQAQIESDFVAKHLKENNRTPTFIDAIEYGMQLMHENIMKGGVEGTVKFVNTGGDDPFVKFICPDLHSSEFRLNQRVKIIILKKEKL